MADERKRFPICETCAKRQGTDRTCFELVEPHSCFICGGLTAKVPSVARRVVREAKRFEFQTFTIGMALPAGVQEREDRLRSELRVRGGSTVKSGLAGEIANLVGREMHKKVNRLHPDLTVLVNLERDAVEMMSRSIFIYGRYTKPRGIPQRRMLCERCNGRGCDVCDAGYSKTRSVEKVVGNRFRKLLHSQRTKFTWLGSEDQDSVVFPPGRPFVVEVKSPRRHAVPRTMALRTGRGVVKVTRLKILKGKPLSVPSFVFRTRAYIESESAVKPSTRDLRGLNDCTVEYRNNKGKLVHKKVHRVLVLTALGRKLTVDIKLDGGLPVKRLISGDSVAPSLAELLKTRLSCQRFDILRVWESGGFEFGKV